MAEITKPQIATVYRFALLWLDGQFTNRAARDRAVAESAISSGSAADLLQITKALRESKQFKRTLSNLAAETLFEAIYRDDGVEGLKRALTACDLHIEYYEGLGKTKRPGLRAVVEAWRAKAAPIRQTKQSIETHFSAFEREVAQLKGKSPRELAKLLPKPGHKPISRNVTARVFDRSPAVVAEVLRMANGKCDACGENAPFKRAKDGSPYLEVHHKKLLSEDGEDTVENAEALCPNCHRKKHFG